MLHDHKNIPDKLKKRKKKTAVEIKWKRTKKDKKREEIMNKKTFLSKGKKNRNQC